MWKTERRSNEVKQQIVFFVADVGQYLFGRKVDVISESRIRS
jgi:hypothetical protein